MICNKESKNDIIKNFSLKNTMELIKIVNKKYFRKKKSKQRFKIKNKDQKKRSYQRIL